MVVAKTPLMKQYYSIRHQYPDGLLLFQMGDFYETFNEDAKKLAKDTGIVLTSRDKREDPTPMAGFPIKALKQYLPKLLKAGHKVIIVDQIDNGLTSGKIVERKVSRIVTPGTINEDQFLQSRENNYLLALDFEGKSSGQLIKRVGLSFIDLSTGLFFIAQFDNIVWTTLLEYLQKINPSEILVADKVDMSRVKDFIIQPVSKDFFNDHTAEKFLLERLGLIHLDSLGIENMSNGLKAAGAILKYVNETQQADPLHIKNIKIWDPRLVMAIDSTTRRNLEIVQNIRTGGIDNTLLQVLDKTKTYMGSRLLRRWLLEPLLDKKAIEDRLDYVEFYKNNHSLTNQIRQVLDQVVDTERLLSKIGLFTINPREVSALSSSLDLCQDLIKKIEEEKELVKLYSKKELEEIKKAVQTWQDEIAAQLHDKPPQEVTEGYIFKSDYNPKIKEYRYLVENAQLELDKILKRERKAIKIPSLKIGHNKVFGFYIEVSNTHKDKVPSSYIRKQTLVNAERYITEELKDLENRIFSAREKLNNLEYKLYLKFRQKLVKFLGSLLKISDFLAVSDIYTCLALNALENNYTRPLFNDQGIIEIKGGRHPVVEQNTPDFIKNDIYFNKHDFHILTGPNMSGKSTYIRQIALIAIMAQMGSFVPAQSATLPIIDKVFARVGASDDISTNRSTFMVEMTEAANIINNATETSLIILDELGRGTSTYDGLSLAWAVSKYIQADIKAKAIFATHFHEMTELTNQTKAFKNYRVTVKEKDDKVYFLHKVEPGKMDKSYGVYVAKLAGLPLEVISQAQEILTDFEQEELISSKNGDKGDKTVRADLPKVEKKNSSNHQLSLLELKPQEQAVIDQLADLDPNKLTPIEALKILDNWKKELDEMADDE